MSVEQPDNNPAHLYPPFAALVEAVLTQATAETAGKHGVSHWVLVEGFRPQARQNWLYAQGRTRPGEIVTHIKISNHTGGMAADCYPVDVHGEVMYDAPDAAWQQLAHCVRCHPELQSGADYPKIFPGSTFVDRPHVEPTAAQRKLWAAGAKAHLKALGLA